MPTASEQDRNKAKTLTDAGGRRVSRYRNGDKRDVTDLVEDETWIQRWEHWICDRAEAVVYFDRHWLREPIPGKVWRSGNQAFRYVRRPSSTASTLPVVEFSLASPA